MPTTFVVSEASAPFESNTRTTSRWPAEDAKIKGVWPQVDSRTSTSTPCAITEDVNPTSPAAAAKWSGVTLPVSVSARGLAPASRRFRATPLEPFLVAK